MLTVKDVMVPEVVTISPYSTLREALSMIDVPLTVTNQVATRPEGDGEGPKDQ